jgi:hypothetical protein
MSIGSISYKVSNVTHSYRTLHLSKRLAPPNCESTARTARISGPAPPAVDRRERARPCGAGTPADTLASIWASWTPLSPKGGWCPRKRGHFRSHTRNSGPVEHDHRDAGSLGTRGRHGEPAHLRRPTASTPAAVSQGDTRLAQRCSSRPRWFSSQRLRPGAISNVPTRYPKNDDESTHSPLPSGG